LEKTQVSDLDFKQTLHEKVPKLSF
jgi:hypothetical protein